MQTRIAQLGQANAEARTAPVTVSSDTPVDRGDYIEVLDHSPGAVDLSRAPLPLILGHDPKALPIGVVENLSVGGGRLRGVARFSDSPQAVQVFRDVQNKIVRSVSVGYEFIDQGVRVEGNTFRFKFRPLEVSALAVGADPHAGFFRSKDVNMNNDTDQDMAQSRKERALAEQQRVDQQLAKIPAADQDDFRAHVEDLAREHELGNSAVLRSFGGVERGYEAWRVKTIRGLGGMWPELDQAIMRNRIHAAISSKRPAAEFQSEVREMIATHHNIPPTNTGALEADRLPYGAGARVADQHSGMRHIQGPRAEERAYRAGQYFKALAGDSNALRWCRDTGLLNERSLGTGVFTAGGALIPDQLAPEIINLTEKYGVFKKYARNWPMDNGSLAIPVKSAGVSVSALSEGTATPTSDPAFMNINLVAKEVGGSCRINRNLLADSPIAVGDFVIGEFAMSLASKEDNCGFLGDGTSTYSGMRGVITLLEDGNHAGGLAAAVAGHNLLAEIDATDLVNLMAICPEYARANAGWYLSATAKDTILTRIAMVAGGNTVQTLQGGIGEAFMGYPVRTSQVLPAGTATDYNNKVVILFGDLSAAAAFGARSGLQIDIDPSRYVEFREVFFQVTERFDIVNHHVGDATTPGPLVGLKGTS